MLIFQRLTFSKSLNSPDCEYSSELDGNGILGFWNFGWFF